MKYKENLIPNEFFMVKGSGCSEHAIHPGSYHIALYEAGIHNYNIVGYSSVIPATAKLISLDEVKLPPFGSELKTIMACTHGYYGEHISAGIIWSWLYKDEEFTEKVGGLVCELAGYFDIEALEERLYTVHNDLHKRTYKDLYLGEQNIITESLTIDMRYGTALAALCFINFL